MSQQLPLYHKNTRPKRGGTTNGSFKLKEAHLMMFLFLTFSLAWCVLIVYMPVSQTTDTGFEATYQKFIHRSLESSPSDDIAAPPKISLPHKPDGGPIKLVRATTPTLMVTSATTTQSNSPVQQTISTSMNGITNNQYDSSNAVERREKVKEVCTCIYIQYIHHKYNVHMYILLNLFQCFFLLYFHLGTPMVHFLCH